MKNKIKFGIIGCGRIGTRHAAQIKKVGILTAVCDIDSIKAEELSKSTKSKPYTCIDTMFKENMDIDLIAICTPNGLHCEHSIKALSNGFHVLCEKPMALSTEDCEEMIKTAEKHNRRLFSVKQNRFNPPVSEVKKLIDQGRLGTIFSFQLSCFWNRNENYYENSWKGSLDMDGGTLYTQFSHFIDLLYWFFGDLSECNSKFANFSHQKNIEFEDTGVVNMRFKSGILGTLNYTVNSFEKNMEGSLTIFGSKGTIKIGGQYLNELEYQNIENHTIENLPKGNPANSYGTYQGSMSNHDKVYQNIIDVFTENKSINTSSIEGLKTVQIIEKIYKDRTISKL